MRLRWTPIANPATKPTTIAEPNPAAGSARARYREDHQAYVEHGAEKKLARLSSEKNARTPRT